MTLKKLTNDHYIIVDDSEIKINDWVYSMDGVHQYFGLILNTEPLPKKIIYSTQPLEQGYGCEIKEGLMLRNVGKELCYDLIKPLSLSEVKELIGEVDMEKKEIILTDSQKELLKMGSVFYKDSSVIYYLPYIIINENNKWYIQLEDNKEKKYTEEDLRKAYYYGKSMMTPQNFEKFIKSLQPKTEWEVEFVDGKLKLK